MYNDLTRYFYANDKNDIAEKIMGYILVEFKEEKVKRDVFSKYAIKQLLEFVLKN